MFVSQREFGSRSFFSVKKCETNIIMKTNLVTIQEAKAVTSSLQVSNTFEKRHDNVLRDIENLKKDVLNFEGMFVESSYLDSYSRKHKMYVINRDGFTLLAMGFTGKKALQFKIDYINAFNKMEEYIKSQSSQTALSKRKATGKRVETYLPNEDVLRLQVAAYQAGYASVYSLLQKMIYEFLENPYRNYQEEIKRLNEDVDYYKNDNIFWRDLAYNMLQTQKQITERFIDRQKRI